MERVTTTSRSQAIGRPARPLRLLYCYRGWNSGTNRAVMEAWQTGCREVELLPRDLEGVLGGRLGKLRALPVAVRRGGLGVLMPGQGRCVEAVKRSAWFLGQVAKAMARIERQERFDACLAMGTVWPRPRFAQPYFIYTDLTILANLYYPQGQRQVDRWQECLPIEKDCLAGAMRVFTMSDHVSRSLQEQYGLPADRIVRVNGGCNSPAPQAEEPDRFERREVLFIGVDWELKGGPELVEAFGRVRRKHPRATLTIVGNSPDVRAEGVRVVGRVPQRDIAGFLARSAVFCLPSKREAFGISYLEAMRAGLPVIAADLGAAPDFVIDGQTGYRVSPLDVDALTARLDELLSDPQKCRDMGQRGRALVESQYTWPKTQQRMWEAMRQALP